MQQPACLLGPDFPLHPGTPSSRLFSSGLPDYQPPYFPPPYPVPQSPIQYASASGHLSPQDATYPCLSQYGYAYVPSGGGYPQGHYGHQTPRYDFLSGEPFSNSTTNQGQRPTVSFGTSSKLDNFGMNFCDETTLRLNGSSNLISSQETTYTSIEQIQVTNTWI